MRSVAPMRTAKTGYIIISFIMCVLGVLLIAVPDFSVSLLGTVCAVMLIVFGAVKLVGFFSKDLYRLAFQYDLALGIMLMVAGIIMLVHPESLMNFICITLGFSFLADGLFKIQTAIDSKKFGLHAWWLILVFAVITVIMGTLLMLRPGEGSRVLSVILGITFLSEGLLSMGTAIAAVKIIKHQQPDYIEIEYRDESEE